MLVVYWAYSGDHNYRGVFGIGEKMNKGFGRAKEIPEVLKSLEEVPKSMQ